MREQNNEVAYADECPQSEQHEISGGPFLAKVVSPKGRDSAV
jgi:hypothetical protein